LPKLLWQSQIRLPMIHATKMRNEESLDRRRRKPLAGCALHAKRARFTLMAGALRFISVFSFALLRCNPADKI
jgi:hypothetical protein